MYVIYILSLSCAYKKRLKAKTTTWGGKKCAKIAIYDREMAYLNLHYTFSGQYLEKASSEQLFFITNVGIFLAVFFTPLSESLGYNFQSVLMEKMPEH